MKISEIQRGSNNVSLTAKVIDVSEKREVNTRFGKRKVADVLLEDETGQISLTLWEDKIDSVRVGDTVTIEGAFVTTFKDKMQINIPKMGKLEVAQT
jgi:replication factor A1